MTLRELLEKTDVRDQSTEARYPDGSGGSDVYHMTLFVRGHGKLLDAEVEEIQINREVVFITLRGEKGGRPQ